MAYTSQYPTQDTDHVKATTTFAGDPDSYRPWFATDPAKSLTGTYQLNAWVSNANSNQRFHIDLGSAIIIRRIYYENSHVSGTQTDQGVKTFTFWGSNNAAAFAELTYATDTNWTQLTIDDSTFDQHAAADAVDPKYIIVTNTVSYRYYACKIADQWGGASAWMALRRIELQTEDGFTVSNGNFFAFL